MDLLCVFSVLCLPCLCARLLICALCSPVGKGLTSLVSNCEFNTFPLVSWARCGACFYYIPITDTTLELFIFWPSDTDSQINELRLSESISLSFNTRLTSVTCFCGDVT